MSELQEAPRSKPPEIPGYHIEAVLGRGASGVVYRAVQLSIGRVVALKVLHPGSLRNDRAVRRLQREARTAARLSHPNIISAIDMGRTGDLWWFAMELVEGPSLAERLDHGGRITERQALRIFIPLCEALQHASEKGVVHRDIKPANILVERDGRPRLVDLGLARVEDDPLITRTGSTLGTPHYISPEQARDASCADVRSDIWSLGATLFHAVCGRPPFTGESAAELMSDVLYGGIPDPRELRPDLSKGLALVLRKCLSRDPERRYFTPEELRDDLERVRDHRAPAIDRRALEPLAAKSGRWGALAAALAGAVVLATALFLWRAFGADRAREAGGAPTSDSWPALEALAADIAAQRISLAEAWAERDELCAEAPAEFAASCRELQQAIAARIDKAMSLYQSELENVCSRLLGERGFDAVEEVIERGAPADVLERTGFRPGELPLRFGPNFRLFVDRQRAALERARRTALDSLAKAVEFYVDEYLLPRVGQLASMGRFDEALDLADRTPAELFEKADADARGLGGEELALRLEPLRSRLASEAERLREQRRALDADLVAWLDECARGHEERLRARLPKAAEAFASDFEDELERRGLVREHLASRLDRAFEWASLARFEERRDELLELERELLAGEAELLFDELDAQAQALCRAREYENAGALWEAHAGDAALEPLADMVALRIQETDLLAGWLVASAAGATALDGREVRIPVGTVPRPGVLEAARDPLQDGFELVYRQGTRDSFRLRKGERASGGARVLDAKAIEMLALADPAGARGSELALQQALFRYHEGDLEGARALIARPGLSDDEYLVHDLALRLETGLDREASAREERRQYARSAVEGLTRREHSGDSKAAIRSIDELLQDFTEFLSPLETAKLRDLRRTLDGGPPLATVEDFQRVFRIQAVELDERGGVVLRYTFAEQEAGTWERGDWSCDGAGWIGTGSVASDAELANAPAPTLALVDPFAFTGASLELAVTFEQPAQSPPNLLVLSAFGFHAAFVRGTAGAPARCLVDTQERAKVIERARDGEGVPFGGFGKGVRHELRLRVNPERGQAWVQVDGVPIAVPLRQKVQKVASVSIRSLEPLRLVAAVVRGGRR